MLDDDERIIRLISEVREARLRLAGLVARITAERAACEKRSADAFQRADTSFRFVRQHAAQSDRPPHQPPGAASGEVL